ncbi:MAG TPA: hypothetical protein PKC55_15140 [Dysgonomonas sp.]|uniref:hypothetical protein n=1 Tax=unclassified Dysgonomonas TaxID=2630389 RepID=UPI0025B9D4E0|nr:MULTISPECIES: hypothetical protein [unclassified Dysgonomonas]HML66164.1 hypothetical protein [Dysgonomonas sp.]
MKKILLTVTLIIACGSLAAQGSMGGMGGGRPPGGGKGRGEGHAPMHQGNSRDESFFIMGIPDIPNLTLEQREKLSKTISDERKDIFKLMQEKQELKMRSENPGIANKERLKLTEKISKTDEKIKTKQEKYDQKYKSILTTEQYHIFAEKKQSVEFREPPRRRLEEKGDQRPSAMPNEGTAPDESPDGMF